jgi:SNF2 family DNA or RNA helicase
MSDVGSIPTGSTIFEAVMIDVNDFIPLFKNPPAIHQIQGIDFCLNKPEPYAALFDEQGTGKSYQMIALACILWKLGLIDTCLIVTPGSVRGEWCQPEFGQIKEHGFVPGIISEYHQREWRLLSKEDVAKRERLYWVITNYEFVRQGNRLYDLIDQIKNRRVMIVADESIFIKTHNSEQTKALLKLREWCCRAYILNGTPISSTHAMDLYAQMNFLSPRILKYTKKFFHFKRRYAVVGGYMGKQIVGVQRMDELNALVKPHILRRLESECGDLPERSYALMEVPLTEQTWRTYVEMRDQMVAWLSDGTVAKSEHAITKLIRLEQITSGYLGGLQPALLDDDMFADVAEVSKLDTSPTTKEISNEKLVHLDRWITARLNEDPYFRVVVWCRFRAEQERAAQFFRDKLQVLRIYGGQKKTERERMLALFGHDDTKTPMVLFGQQQAGGFGLNLQKYCHNVVYVSNDYSMVTRSQSEKRVHRRGQTKRVLITDMVAVGPRGQKTINHIVLRALRNKLDFAEWTTNEWRAELEAA